MNSKWVILILVILSILCCVCLIGMALTGGLAAWGISRAASTEVFEEFPAPSQLLTDMPFDEFDSFLTPEPPSDEPQAIPTLVREPADADAYETLNTLKSQIVPNNDMRELAKRLGGKGNIPEVVPPATEAAKLGEKRSFWVTNVDTNENFQVTGVLRYIGTNLYFWIEDGVSYNERELKNLSEAFDQKIYPTNREFFGSEWSPGIDQDPRLYILLAGGLGNNLAGYFSSADSVHPLAHEYSNAHEMFLLNADNIELGEEFTYGVLAHEFQHMIHWYRDRNEESWLNEGFSELASFLNNYDPGGFDMVFMSDPDLQLNDWPNDPSATGPHYGAGFLFVTYFLDRLGEEATRMLVAHPDNGLDSVDTVLNELGKVDSLTGEPMTADELFRDWTVANYLRDGDVADGRYTYHNYKNAPQVYSFERFSTCPTGERSGTVSQYGTDYYVLSCEGDVTLKFEGTTEVGVLPEQPYSGEYAFWSNKGDESDMMLTQRFDFSSVSGNLKMSFRTWYDLEKDYDYLYLLASKDNGQSWEIVKTPSGTDQDPSGNSYGWAYNGVTNGWIEETVDLSAYAGQTVMLRFEYVTDAAVNGEGFLLDDVSIPAIQYFSDFETDNGGWESAGWVRIQNRLPQTFLLTVVEVGGTTTVVPVTLDETLSAEIPLSFSSGTKEVVIVVSGTTRFTRQPASYRFSVK